MGWDRPCRPIACNPGVDVLEHDLQILERHDKLWILCRSRRACTVDRKFEDVVLKRRSWRDTTVACIQVPEVSTLYRLQYSDRIWHMRGDK